ncbi:galactose oxidase [Moesziomyces antarcticus]|uniref:Related to Tip elongation aberrant protein 1 n=2 Tax=Pseudozyma antarctica TaxID=84753 RepID=A0A5C3FN95_PSEA2|nr:galactose oxidase [Moesziomyces antarcticus]GAK64711.1 galactose oxidase [Moesziomyces antarcticus]SPO45696.1 related to Tip elongation aberrant protein 1 [Moesziomyces antarcticus]
MSRNTQDGRDPTSVQVLGMNISHSQPLARNMSGTGDVTPPSGASTPHQQGDYAAARTYIPSHGFTASRLQNQSSFSTGTSQSPASSEAHEELASFSSRSASHNDASTAPLASAAADSSMRRSYVTRGNRSLNHKDSFGGSYGFNAAPDLSAESADEASTPSVIEQSRLSHAQADGSTSEGHHRNISLSRAAKHARNGAPLAFQTRQQSVGHNDAVAGLTDAMEVLGRSAADPVYDASTSRISRSPSVADANPNESLAAAANAASRFESSESAWHPNDTTFSASSAYPTASDRTERHYTSTSNAPSSTAPDRPSVQAEVPGLPQIGGSESQSVSAATQLPSHVDDHYHDGSVHRSRSNGDLLQPGKTPGGSDLLSASQKAEHKPQHAERRDQGARDKASQSTIRRPGSSRTRDTATTASSSNRPDATNPAGRSLKTTHRVLPQLPSAQGVRPAPPPAMYWSKAPVHGSVPRRSFRAHTANLCDEVLWLFGGCDNRGCFRDLWCFDTETMCWSKPKVTGDIPPARRAHSATMVNKRLFVFAGGDGPHYFNDLFVFDTVSLRWSKPEIGGTAPSPRRAHTCNYYEGQLIIFGGGNGVGALNDVHTLDVTDLSRLEWRKMECSGKVPIGRGYHTSNLVDGKLIVIGGSDGHMSFNDIHILRLDTQTWYQVKTEEIHNRLGHTATQVGSYLFIFGGHDSKTYTSELLTLNLVNLQWEPRKVCGKKPQGRGYHQAWLRDSRLFVHGGFDGKDIFDDLHFLDLAACAYLPQITSFSVELDDEE